MTIQEARDQITAIYDRTDIGLAQKAAMVMRVKAQARRDNPDMDFDELSV